MLILTSSILKISAFFTYQTDNYSIKKSCLPFDTNMTADILCIPNVAVQGKP